MLYKDAVEDLIGNLKKQIKTTNSDLKRTKQFHLPQIVSKNNDCEKKINKTIEEKPIQTIKTQKLTHTQRSPILTKRKHFIEKRDLNLLDECQVYVWKLPKGNVQSTRQQRIYSTIK